MMVPLAAIFVALLFNLVHGEDCQNHPNVSSLCCPSWIVVFEQGDCIPSYDEFPDSFLRSYINQNKLLRLEVGESMSALSASLYYWRLTEISESISPKTMLLSEFIHPAVRGNELNIDYELYSTEVELLTSWENRWNFCPNDDGIERGIPDTCGVTEEQAGQWVKAYCADGVVSPISHFRLSICSSLVQPLDPSTSSATLAPTNSPTVTQEPTTSPTITSVPTTSPTITSVPTTSPTITPVPTTSPTITSAPTTSPTITSVPTTSPTITSVPTTSPTITSEPTISPTITSTGIKTTTSPTNSPTASVATNSPTANQPTRTPTASPAATSNEALQLVAWQTFWDKAQGSNWLSCYLRRNSPCTCISPAHRRVYCDSEGLITEIILQSNRLETADGSYPLDEIKALLSIPTLENFDITGNSRLPIVAGCVDLPRCSEVTCNLGDVDICQHSTPPTSAPSATLSPTSTPSHSPSKASTPTVSPTASPHESTKEPAAEPTAEPGEASPPSSPTTSPEAEPAMGGGALPNASESPTSSPSDTLSTEVPTASPSLSEDAPQDNVPSSNGTTAPTKSPSSIDTPTSSPTQVDTPTSSPTRVDTPTSSPTRVDTPTSSPTQVDTPTSSPTKITTEATCSTPEEWAVGDWQLVQLESNDTRVPCIGESGYVLAATSTQNELGSPSTPSWCKFVSVTAGTHLEPVLNFPAIGNKFACVVPKAILEDPSSNRKLSYSIYHMEEQNMVEYPCRVFQQPREIQVFNPNCLQIAFSAFCVNQSPRWLLQVSGHSTSLFQQRIESKQDVCCFQTGNGESISTCVGLSKVFASENSDVTNVTTSFECASVGQYSQVQLISDAETLLFRQKLTIDQECGLVLTGVGGDEEEGTSLTSSSSNTKGKGGKMLHGDVYFGNIVGLLLAVLVCGALIVGIRTGIRTILYERNAAIFYSTAVENILESEEETDITIPTSRIQGVYGLRNGKGSRKGVGSKVYLNLSNSSSSWIEKSNPPPLSSNPGLPPDVDQGVSLEEEMRWVEPGMTGSNKAESSSNMYNANEHHDDNSDECTNFLPSELLNSIAARGSTGSDKSTQMAKASAAQMPEKRSSSANPRSWAADLRAQFNMMSHKRTPTGGESEQLVPSVALSHAVDETLFNSPKRASWMERKPAASTTHKSYKEPENDFDIQPDIRFENDDVEVEVNVVNPVAPRASHKSNPSDDKLFPYSKEQETTNRFSKWNPLSKPSHDEIATFKGDDKLFTEEERVDKDTSIVHEDSTLFPYSSQEESIGVLKNPMGESKRRPGCRESNHSSEVVNKSVRFPDQLVPASTIEIQVDMDASEEDSNNDVNMFSYLKRNTTEAEFVTKNPMAGRSLPKSTMSAQISGRGRKSIHHALQTPPPVPKRGKRNEVSMRGTSQVHEANKLNSSTEDVRHSTKKEMLQEMLQNRRKFIADDAEEFLSRARVKWDSVAGKEAGNGNPSTVHLKAYDFRYGTGKGG